MHLPHNSLVLVADGAKLLFFRNQGDGAHADLKVVDAEQQADPRDGDLKSDRAGRSAGGDAMGEADYHDQAEARFAADAADRLKAGALAGDYDALVVVAPPRTLGVLRKHYHAEVEKRLVAELPKDLTGHSVDKIEKILADSPAG